MVGIEQQAGIDRRINPWPSIEKLDQLSRRAGGCSRGAARKVRQAKGTIAERYG
jgi:hypothetical protein